MFSKRTIAKFAAFTTVSVATTKATDTAIESFTEIDTDSAPVSIGTSVLGFVVALKLEPVTDTLVDNIADRWQARKDRKKDNQ